MISDRLNKKGGSAALGRFRRLSSLSFRSFVAAAALLHLLLALTLFVAARAQVAPSTIDRDGIMSSFASDGLEYQRGAIELVDTLKHGDVRAWILASQPVHVKAISICFAVLGPIFGYGTLSAEPFNLVCYVLMLTVVFALGREVGGQRVALLSAATVAVWPTLLLHSLQLLKDVLFISGALAIVALVTTWLTRTYGRKGAVAIGLVTASTVFLVMRVRFNVGILVVAVVICGFVLLGIRQLLEKRVLGWNMVCAVPALLTAAAIIALPATHHSESFKHSPSDQSGLSKAVIAERLQVATAVVYRPQVLSRVNGLHESRLWKRADEIALLVGSSRARFSLLYPDAGSGLDGERDIRTFSELVSYLPRAGEIGMWAPFPYMWFSAGRSVGKTGKLLAGGETLAIYALQMMAVVGLIRFRRQLSLWLLMIVVMLGVTALALLVTNVGALYRFRYTFWVLLIVAGLKAFQSVTATRRFRWRTAVPVAMLAAILVGSCACSTQAAVDQSGNSQSEATSGSSSQRPGNANLGFTLVNCTGLAIRAVYLSRSDSASWEENILTVHQLNDGDSVDIRFSPEENAQLWDLRIEGTDQRYAEWKNLSLGSASRIALFLKIRPEPAVVAEIEQR